MFKCPLTNTGYTVRDGDTGQTITIIERIIANAGDTVRDSDIGQTFAVDESLISNAGNTVRNHHLFYGIHNHCRCYSFRAIGNNHLLDGTTVKYSIAHTSHTIRDSDTSQTGATRERIIANAGDSIWDDDTGQPCTTSECTTTNRRNTIRNCDAR